MSSRPSNSAPQAVVEPLINVALSERIARREGLGDVEPVDAEQQFIDEVAKWLQRWFDFTPPEIVAASEPAVFIFSGDHDVNDVLPASTLQPGFRRVTDALISGNVYCCSLGMRGVRSTHVGFLQATDATRWCSADQLDTFTAVIVAPRTREALVKRAGQDVDECDGMRFAKPRTVPFTFAEMDQVLQNFHDDWTKTHHGHCRIWAKPSERKLKPGAEGQIQGNLMGYLRLVVRPEGTLIDQEVFTQRGRADIRITIWPTAASPQTCYLELKVLRREKSKKFNQWWAFRGISQVLGYREKDQTIGPSYLCCYDGRDLDRRMVKVENEANRKGVIAKRFFMQTEL